MNEFGLRILLCKASQDVCILAFSVCKMDGWLGPVVNELKENLFVSF